MGDERRGNGPCPEFLPHETCEQDQGMALVLPEGAPDAIRNRLGKIRSVAQIADRDSAQRSVSSRRVMSLWRGAMDDISPYSWSVCAPSPSMPRPSRVGMPRAAVKLPSEPPPTRGAETRSKPISAASDLAWSKSREVASLRS